jgi:hypothetical protein
MTRSPGSCRGDSGVISVVVAIMSLVLLGTAAIAVDMGNAYARKRRVQTGADLAALAGGAKLPATTTASKQAAVSAVLDYLNRNATFGQTTTTWTTTTLQDGSEANGEVQFLSASRMRVVAPPARVEFGLAAALGFSAVDVNAEATVEIRSPGSALPMWLPSDCAMGRVMGDAGSGGSTPEATGSYNPPGSPDHRLNITITPTSAAYGASVPMTVNLNDLPTGSTTARIAFSYGATEKASYPVSWTVPVTTKSDDRSVTITVGTNVTNTSGTWQVWAAAKNLKGVEAYSAASVPFTVAGGSMVGCSASVRGNFGQIRSPRRDTTQNQNAYALNVALGLDHSVVPFPSAYLPAGGLCTSSTPYAQLDDEPARDDRNCIYVDPGNDGPGLTSGLISGVDGYPGRLAAATTCPGRPALVMKGVSLNNDVLSCFLPPGTPVGAIATAGSPAPTGVLSPDIFDSPRFFWVPIVAREERDGKKFLAIKGFAPVFQTDESLAATKSASDASATNGITMNGGGTQVSSVQVIAFDPAALPETTTSNGAGIPYVGSGTRLVSLIQ